MLKQRGVITNMAYDIANGLRYLHSINIAHKWVAQYYYMYIHTYYTRILLHMRVKTLHMMYYFVQHYITNPLLLHTLL